MFISIYFWLLLFCFIVLINYLYQFYTNVKKYPTGPLPIPVFGNLLMLIMKRNTHPLLAIHSICQPYGDLCTFWFGSKPVVIIRDLVIGKNAFNSVECSGRPVTSISLFMTGDSFESYGFKDYSKEIQFLRKLSFESIRQLLSSNKINEVVKEVVTETMDSIKSRESDQQYPCDNMLQILIRILSELTFGRSYSADDNELKFITHSLEIFNNEILKISITDFVPIFKYILTSNANSKSELKKLNNLFERTFEECKDSYKPGMCDNISNSLMTARNKMLSEEREVTQYMTDSNLVSVMSTMFLGGSDTTYNTFNWIQLILAHYPDVQQKLRNEINDKLGKNSPKVEDRNKFSYVNAFIHESMRFRSIGPFGLFHKTMQQTNISNFSIPNNTILLMDLYGILNDPKHWNDPKTFIPERFLDSNGCFISNRFPAFIPFSTGKRVCVGERMAIDMIFLILVSLLQSTDGYQFVLANGPQSHDLDYCSKPSFFLNPNPYKIIVKKI